MDLHDEFEVRLPVAEAWTVLTNIEKITPFLPGIWLQEVEGEKYLGVVKVKVGPVTVWYEGIARYLLLDADARKAVLKAEGGEIHGQGKGTAVVTATLSPSARGTRVQVVTVLSVDGRLAQFAKGVIAAVSRNLIAEFAENLELTMPAAPNATTAGPVVGTETAEGADKAPAEASPRR
jgi:carbon monoxide dehydrogenase subunit G